MSFILIDRRKAGKGKSTNNRQKLIRRIKSFIKTAIPQNIGQASVTGAHQKTSSPVKVTGNALEEHFFAYSESGKSTMVIVGNDGYDRGDEIDFNSQDKQGSGAGQGDNGEDDFIINVARDEFLDLFFEDCELPNLTHEKVTEKLDNNFQPSGFSTTGSPAQLSVIRSYKQSLARRWALMAPHKTEREELELEFRQLEERVPGTEYLSEEKIVKRMAEIIERLEELGAKITMLDGFDKIDLRYKKKEAKPLNTIESVLIMIMDISGSMGQEEKTVARRWFALLYAFIKRRYGSTDLIFIAHTTEAFEMSEGDFFSTRINGGTSVSPALDMANKIIIERFDPNQTNIYVAHASDGDNWETDNALVAKEMLGAAGLANKIQMFSYAEVGKQSGKWYSGSKTQTNLWESYDSCRTQLPNKKMVLSVIETADDCYPVFKRIFRKANK